MKALDITGVVIMVEDIMDGEVPEESTMENLAIMDLVAEEVAAIGEDSKVEDGSKLPENSFLTLMRFARKSLVKNLRREKKEVLGADVVNGLKRELRSFLSQRKPLKSSQVKSFLPL